MQNNKLLALRHSVEHVLTQAMEKIYPGIKKAMGPATEDGFYFDFELEQKISENDFPKIEKEMKKIVNTNLAFKKEEMEVKKARKLFAGNTYKQEWLDEIEKKQEKAMIYRTGDKFTDLCSGPHVESTGKIGAFKLTKIAGAYWRGDEKNKMLQRIYGVAFEKENELKEYLKMLEEAERRDHRKLGKELELFMNSEEVGQGMIMFLPKGAFIYKKLEDYMYEKERRAGYHYVKTPVLARGAMYEKSGHLAHYKEDMYNPVDIEGEDYYLKPMNCPHSHIMYKYNPKSYRDLPYRLADFGMLHRYERSGVLSGIIRARNFAQNDAHIYCRKDQVKEEFIKVLKLFDEVYKDFNIKDHWFRLSLPDYDNKEKYGDIENKEMWEYSSQIAREAMRAHGSKFVEAEGEAAFYGPKVDVQIKNTLGKEDSIATVQIDFYMPERFDLEFTNEKGEKERPVIIHRAIMGSFERFFAFLIEQTEGNFPLWLSPTQIVVISVGESHRKYCKKLAGELKEKDLRVEVWDEDETVGNKIRKAVAQKIPYMLVIGDKEISSDKLHVRKRGSREVEEIKKEKFLAEVDKIIENKEQGL